MSYNEEKSYAVAKARKELEEYLSEKTKDNFGFRGTLDCFIEYINYCNKKGYPKCTRIYFSRRVCKEFGMTTKKYLVQAKQRQVFVYSK